MPGQCKVSFIVCDLWECIFDLFYSKTGHNLAENYYIGNKF